MDLESTWREIFQHNWSGADRQKMENSTEKLSNIPGSRHIIWPQPGYGQAIQLRLKRNGKRQTKTKLDTDALEEVQTRHEFAHRLEIMLDQQGRLDNINERFGALTSCIQQAMQETLPSIKIARKPYITASLEPADKKEYWNREEMSWMPLTANTEKRVMK